MAEGGLDSSSGGERPGTNISRATIVAAFNRYRDLESQLRQQLPNSLRERGILHGRLAGATKILEAMHQNTEEEPAEDMLQPSLDEVTRGVMAEYGNAYIIYLLSRGSRPPIALIDRLRGKAGSVRGFWEETSGINEGKREELRKFLKSLGAQSQIQDMEQCLNRLYELNPEELRRQVRKEGEVRVLQALNRLKEVTDELKSSLDEPIDTESE